MGITDAAEHSVEAIDSPRDAGRVVMPPAHRPVAVVNVKPAVFRDATNGDEPAGSVRVNPKYGDPVCDVSQVEGFARWARWARRVWVVLLRLTAPFGASPPGVA
ncbi:MAG TPA: hypothetical protein DCR52_02215 [Actinobacteria bacterium]|nr:hypothetical protein [Actinomycetota bacterium]